MTSSTAASSSPAATRHWIKILANYRTPDRVRSIAELAITLLPFALLWALCSVAIHYGLWWGLLLIVPAAGFLLRLFIIQHDCGHGAFFGHRRADDWTGRVIGVLTLTPYDYWRRCHAHHHATTGNLAQRGLGDILTLTVDEYLGRSRWGRLRYRIYRNPIVLFGFGPAWLFFFEQRLPIGLMRAGPGPWLSAVLTNLGIVVLSLLLIWLVGLVPFLLIHLPIVMIAASLGVWLFYVQHQFEETCWMDGADWEFQEAALHGSSHYVLPKILRWFSGNIGVHHVHHLSSKVPYYRLPEVLRDHPDLADIGRITIPESFSTVRLTLWSADRRKLISFKDALAGREGGQREPSLVG
ncbi:fatty acid desaturase [Fulvimarina sp. MAC3]|uniref:fatty acid desaturase n=1 Tax=Fulvimarina sp. MAC3 TaxID=3148887 RepID=UPI0031FC79BA